jgi:hypothetical protein
VLSAKNVVILVSLVVLTPFVRVVMQQQIEYGIQVLKLVHVLEDILKMQLISVLPVITHV